MQNIVLKSKQNLPKADFPIESTDEILVPAFCSNHGKKSSQSSSK